MPKVGIALPLAADKEVLFPLEADRRSSDDAGRALTSAPESTRNDRPVRWTFTKKRLLRVESVTEAITGDRLFRFPEKNKVDCIL